MFKVKLASCGNPDHGENPSRPMPGCEKSGWHSAATIEELQTAVRDFITRNDLGSGNWAGGEVREDSGRVVGKISYNGRYWPKEA